MNREIKFRAWDKINNNIVNSLFTIRPDNGDCIVDEISGDEIISRKADYELMQYTGLKDIHKNKIYDGYIMITPQGYRYVVKQEWYEIAGFEVFGYKNMSEDIIIGNIYENPELLKSNN